MWLKPIAQTHTVPYSIKTPLRFPFPFPQFPFHRKAFPTEYRIGCHLWSIYLMGTCPAPPRTFTQPIISKGLMCGKVTKSTAMMEAGVPFGRKSANEVQNVKIGFQETPFTVLLSFALPFSDPTPKPRVRCLPTSAFSL